MDKIKITGDEPAQMATMSSGYVGCTPGLTIRQEFAARAMEGIIANHTLIDSGSREVLKWVASFAVILADFLIEELNK